MTVFMCTKPSKRCDHLFHGKIFYIHSRFLYDLIQSFFCCICSLFIFNVYSSGTYQHIAMNSRGDQYTFAIFAWKGKYRSAYMTSCTFVQETVIPSSWSDMYFIFAYYGKHLHKLPLHSPHIWSHRLPDWYESPNPFLSVSDPAPPY